MAFLISASVSTSTFSFNLIQLLLLLLGLNYIATHLCATALRFINQMHLSDKKAARLSGRQAGRQAAAHDAARTDRRLQQIVKISLKSVAERERERLSTGYAAQVARHRIFIFITAQHFRSVTNARNCPPNSDSISIFQSSHRIESAQLFLLCHLQRHSIWRSPLDSLCAHSFN